VNVVSRKRAKVVLERLVLPLAGVALAIFAWWLASLHARAILIPSPASVFEAVRRDFIAIPALNFYGLKGGGIYANLIYTTVNVMLGVGIGAIGGFIVGIALARSRLLRDSLGPLLLLAGTVPMLIALPFFIIWFGTSRIGQAGLVIFYSGLIVTTVTSQAAFNVAGRYEKYASSLGAGEFHRLVSVVLPAVIPEVVGALRVALAAGWGLEVVAEILGSPQGIGRVLQVMVNSSLTADLIGVLVCVGIVAVAADSIGALAGRWLVRWQA
jgi:ABC-type nitrate/sulfonate/bicarbonate transport system permease component